MNIANNQVLTIIKIFILLSLILVATGCSTSPSLPRGAIGNPGLYNYSPSIIETQGLRQFWWCSQGVNPSDNSQDTDTIYYGSMNMATLSSSHPILVLAESPGTWDSAFTCNPKVIGGVFDNPLGDGKSYSYAMYYVATADPSGNNNSIGVAFSNDGISWNKYPYPVISSSSQGGYGVGQPALYNADRKAAIRLFYEDSNPSPHHIAAVSTDGLHFTVQGTLTSLGLDSDDPQATWGDMAYDPNAGEWYAAFNRPLRPPSATGGVQERGQYGIELYKIPQSSLFTGALPWQQLAIMDTNATGFESNFIAGFVRDSYGNIAPASYPAIDIYASVSYPSPSWAASPAEEGMSASTWNWILMPMEWAPNLSPAIALNRYFNGSAHEVTTGWVSPDAGFQLEQTLGHLYASPLNGASVPFYGCKAGLADYFVSLDINCEGYLILGKNGYAYSQSVPGLNLMPLYRCRTAHDHFVSKDPKCEGQITDGLLGYVLP